jgi:hypothetical protein
MALVNDQGLRVDGAAARWGTLAGEHLSVAHGHICAERRLRRREIQDQMAQEIRTSTDPTRIHSVRLQVLGGVTK